MNPPKNFRIAHISDLHILSLAGAVPWRLFNKRLTGYANLRLRRTHLHKAEIVRTIAAHLRASDVDHLVITGDLSNLSLETEFEKVRELLDTSLGFSTDKVSIVPGNHDVYTRGSVRTKRFYRFFEPYLQSDLPEIFSSHPAGRFPFVKLRGPAAIIGLATAVSQPPFVAAGRLGRGQLDALRRILDHPEVARRTPVFLQHHPAHNPASLWKTLFQGLHDAGELSDCLARVPRGLLLHGHLHRRIWRRLPTMTGHVDAVGATSASLLHDHETRMGGVNLYEIGPTGDIVSIESQRLEPKTGRLHPVRMLETH